MEAVAWVRNSQLARYTAMAAAKLEGSMAVPRMEVRVPVVLEALARPPMVAMTGPSGRA